MKEIVYVIVLSIGSIVTLFILTKLMGYRQMSQMSMFDYINGITIGSIAAEMATSLEENYIQPLTAMIVYAAAAIFLSWIGTKSIKARRFIEGKPIILLDNDTLYFKNLKKAKLDISEFLVMCRLNGYFDISTLKTAILEGNGQISFLPKASDRPATPKDLNLNPAPDYLVTNVIIDGKILYRNLSNTGKDIKWLNNQLEKQGCKKIEDILLATCDKNNTLTLFYKKPDEEPKDLLI